MKIVELTRAQSDAYKDFFNQGLDQLPDYFRISVEDDKDLIFPTYEKEDSFTLAAIIGHQMAGVVSFQREGSNRSKLRHKGLLFRMYVEPKHSGQGIGTMLIKELLERVKKLESIEQINLTVIAGNLAAAHLYKKFGFKVFSKETKAVKHKGVYFDEESMVLFL